MQTKSDGVISPNGVGRSDIGALGTSVPSEEPEEFPMPNYKQGGGIGNPETQCRVNGHPMSCSRMKNLVSAWGVSTI